MVLGWAGRQVQGLVQRVDKEAHAQVLGEREAVQAFARRAHDGGHGVDGAASEVADQCRAALHEPAKRGITRDDTPFLLILQGMTLQLQGMNLPPF